MGKMIKKTVQRSGEKSFKIDKICDVMWWTSDSSGFINLLKLSKYLLESTKTMHIESPR